MYLVRGRGPRNTEQRKVVALFTRLSRAFTCERTACASIGSKAATSPRSDASYAARFDHPHRDHAD